MITPEQQSRIAIYRQKAVDGSLTKADCLDFVLTLREGRMSASIASEGARAKAKKAAGPVLDGDALLDDLFS